MRTSMPEHRVDLVERWAAAFDEEVPAKLGRQWVSVVRRAGRDNQCDPTELSGEQITAWRKGFTAHTERCYGTPLRAWFRWLVDEGHRRDNPMIRRAPGPSRRPRSGVMLLDGWAQWMRAGGMRPRTVEERVRIIERAARVSDVHAAAMTADHLAAWLAGCVSPSTRATYYAAAKAWHR